MGWITYTHHPRFGGNYRGLTNRLDLLLESYAYISFKERVLTTYAFLRETLAYVAANGGEIVDLLAQCTMPPDRIAVRYGLEAFPDREVEILTREPYTLDGAPIAVKVPYIGDFTPQEWVQRPWGYAVPEVVAQHLERHGLRAERGWEGTALVEVATVRGAAVEAG